MEEMCSINSNNKINELNFVSTPEIDSINNHNDSDNKITLTDSSNNESTKTFQENQTSDLDLDKIKNLSEIDNLDVENNQDVENKLPNEGEHRSESLQLKHIEINDSLDPHKSQLLVTKFSHSNLIQSSVPLINKSRNLLNFITEKSTNIMEKALLPQYLQQKEMAQKLGNCEEREGADQRFGREDDSLEGGKEEINEVEVNGEEMDCGRLLEELRKVSRDKMMLEERIKELEINQVSKEPVSPSIDNRDATISRLTSELRSALSQKDALLHQYSSANKERESMVMKYAISEKQRLDLQRTLEQSHSRLKQLTSDKEVLTSKLKTAFNERSRVTQMLDVKCRELIDAQKELEKLREDLDLREVKLKWTQTKLKSELQSHKETSEKLEKASLRIDELKDECENVRRESCESIKKFQQSEENKAVTLDHQLKEQHARLILERHVVEDKEAERLQLLKEIETLNHRQQVLIEENSALTLRNNDLDAIYVELKRNFDELEVVSEERLKAINDLTVKAETLEGTRLELMARNQELLATESELQRLQAVNKELQVDMDCSVQRENQMLEFTQKLTDKNVRLQSEFTITESRMKELEKELVPFREQVKELKARIKEITEELRDEKKKRVDECELLARHLAEQTKMAENLKQMLEDSKGENLVLKRKHQMTIKELTREVGQLKKKLEGTSPAIEGAVQTRTPSVLSLNEEADKEAGVIYNELDKQALVDRVIKLQRVNVKRAEKLDFLEEHTRVLVAELQKKTKIIQNYVLSESFDAMGSNERDKYKAELIKHGGIMASVYHQRVTDDNMTLELSLEINQKLQTVLEDALLKNITLKDNIDTLGDEIAKLTIQNQKTAK
ncbi:coiled-coil domain-containing protein 186 isoform X2 [Cotesia glomerata]|uniref:coiled-coil domain-containing protein 186 isoform X2 n=1 Tax=Cotesia glomerata TaxID=32391 RepID=UPI001D033F6C|nr:coiled-coil domain-containing protein 186 isoform X2 [Cotesia glomerata]